MFPSDVFPTVVINGMTISSEAIGSAVCAVVVAVLTIVARQLLNRGGRVYARLTAPGTFGAAVLRALQDDVAKWKVEAQISKTWPNQSYDLAYTPEGRSSAKAARRLMVVGCDTGRPTVVMDSHTVSHLLNRRDRRRVERCARALWAKMIKDFNTERLPELTSAVVALAPPAPDAKSDKADTQTA
jgi:hypothetical protein